MLNFGEATVTKVSGLFAASVAVNSSTENASGRPFNLSATCGLNETSLELSLGAFFGTVVWLCEGSSVKLNPIHKASATDCASWDLKQLRLISFDSALPSIDPESIVNGKGVAYLTIESKPFCCPGCSRRSRTESDARKHYLCKHVETQVPVLSIAYEDEHCSVVVKPQGMETLGAGSFANSSMLDSLKPSPLPGALSKARPCHRLDTPTGGLIVVAKTQNAMRGICQAFREHRVRKRYRALVAGKVASTEGVITKEVDGKPSKTRFKVVGDPTPSSRFGFITTVDLWPETGRKHQLRKHLSFLQHPIVGETKYGERGHRQAAQKGEELCLWALEVSFEVDFEKEIPEVTPAEDLSLEDSAVASGECLEHGHCKGEICERPGALGIRAVIAEPPLFEEVRRKEAMLRDDVAAAQQKLATGCGEEAGNRESPCLEDNASKKIRAK